MVAKASEIAEYKISNVLALTLRKYALILDHTNSTGLKSDEYTDKNTTTTLYCTRDLKHPSPYVKTNYPTPKHPQPSSQAPKPAQHKNQTTPHSKCP